MLVSQSSGKQRLFAQTVPESWGAGMGNKLPGSGSPHHHEPWAMLGLLHKNEIDLSFQKQPQNMVAVSHYLQKNKITLPSTLPLRRSQSIVAGINHSDALYAHTCMHTQKTACTPLSGGLTGLASLAWLPWQCAMTIWPVVKANASWVPFPSGPWYWSMSWDLIRPTIYLHTHKALSQCWVATLNGIS